MPKLPRMSGAVVVRALERLGFARIRQQGSPRRVEETHAGRQCRVRRAAAQRTRNWNIKWHLEAGEGHAGRFYGSTVIQQSKSKTYYANTTR